MKITDFYGENRLKLSVGNQKLVIIYIFYPLKDLKTFSSIV